ncbi:rhomboid family intramembrane serine protease [Streptomyces spongiicola]|uniref:Rhomboid family intramembrane serine protease n=1 Tax=Streptomyces spongiicola TaxID=1690221 RepID=A0A2S1Z2K5_9ACTN|nr:rhomboid family intramembrane serine protease [Streptomyces spongiicola]AWK10138.1 rhomboid family intramembrane serine protease [Streptomyces spongiicola]GBQ00898.1 rhomboid family intramembrane serine protease [Streptomyces spongiicola]
MDQAPGSPDRPQAAHGLPGCYRHPGRETGISCTRCERPICPECMVSASVGFQCPECVRTGSGTGHAPSASRPRTIAGAEVTGGDPRLVTKILLGVNAAVFLAVLADRTLADQLNLIALAFDPRLRDVVGVADGEWYRLLTSVFLHQQIWHIAFNMLGLWWLGGPLEAALGRVRYLALYLLSGLAGSTLVYLLAEPNQGALGASGAIWGLLGATAVLLRRLDYDLRPVIALLALNLLFTFTMPGISWEAHVGGLVGGTVIAFGMVHAPRERRTLVQAGVCALVLLAAVVAIVLRTQSLLT